MSAEVHPKVSLQVSAGKGVSCAGLSLGICRVNRSHPLASPNLELTNDAWKFQESSDISWLVHETWVIGSHFIEKKSVNGFF